MPPKPPAVELTVAKWGNSLALRLPMKTAERAGLSLGDRVTAEILADQRLVLSRSVRPIDAAGIRRLCRFLDHQTESAPVVAEMRRKARY